MTVSFKKDGVDPTQNRQPYMGGLSFVGALSAMMGLGVAPPISEHHQRYGGHYRGKPPPRKKRHNSVRRKHRRAAA